MEGALWGALSAGTTVVEYSSGAGTFSSDRMTGGGLAKILPRIILTLPSSTTTNCSIALIALRIPVY